MVGGPIRARLEIINYYITLITCFIMIHIWWLVINDSWTNELLLQFLARLISYRFEVIARVHAVKNAIFRGFIPHRLWVIAYSNKLDQLIPNMYRVRSYFAILSGKNPFYGQKWPKFHIFGMDSSSLFEWATKDEFPNYWTSGRMYPTYGWSTWKFQHYVTIPCHKHLSQILNRFGLKRAPPY